MDELRQWKNVFQSFNKKYSRLSNCDSPIQSTFIYTIDLALHTSAHECLACSVDFFGHQNSVMVEHFSQIRKIDRDGHTDFVGRKKSWLPSDPIRIEPFTRMPRGHPCRYEACWNSLGRKKNRPISGEHHDPSDCIEAIRSSLGLGGKEGGIWERRIYNHPKEEDCNYYWRVSGLVESVSGTFISCL